MGLNRNFIVRLIRIKSTISTKTSLIGTPGQQPFLLFRRTYNDSINPTKVAIDHKLCISKMLYRQLIRCVKTIGSPIPLDPMPPFTLLTPNVDKTSLRALSQALSNHQSTDSNYATDKDYSNNFVPKQLTKLLKVMPPNSEIVQDKLIIPLTDTSQVLNVVRLVYGMNHLANSDEHGIDRTSLSGEKRRKVVNERISLALEMLKTLNEMKDKLETRKAKRHAKVDRLGVNFVVGQVVQHKKRRWRGVITDWNISIPSSSQKTSLTLKKYKTSDEKQLETEGEKKEETFQAAVFYSVLLDAGDSFNSRVAPKCPVNINQSDLESVKDPLLRRIRNNWVKNRFSEYNSELGQFSPNNILEFEYPSDFSDKSRLMNDEYEHINQVANTVKEGLKELASQLNELTCNESSRIGKDTMAMQKLFEKNLNIILNSNGKSDDYIPYSHSSNMNAWNSSPSLLKEVVTCLKALLNISLEISDVTWKRRTAAQSLHRIKYPLGTVVKHANYGFRGMVVAWDPNPSRDVSQLKGFDELEGDGTKMPCYLIVPDRNDIIEVLGAQQQLQLYVFEEHLEYCPVKERNIEIDALDDNWVKDDPAGLEYTVPHELKFKHAESFQDENIIVEYIENLKNGLTVFYKNIQEKCNRDHKVSLDNLFLLLKSADNLHDASIIQETIKEIWKFHDQEEVRWKLDDGIHALLMGKKQDALSIFNTIIKKDDQNYSEAWNKKATCHYMLGEMEQSMQAAKKTLLLNERHFQSLSGLGLVYYETNNFKSAEQEFRKCLSLDPWSPASSRLSACTDKLKCAKSYGQDMDTKNSKELTHLKK